MITISEIKTPNCIKCKSIESDYNSLKEEFISKFPDKIEFKEYVLSINNEAKDYMLKYNLKSAPSFVIEIDKKDGKTVKFEDLKNELSSILNN